MDWMIKCSLFSYLIYFSGNIILKTLYIYIVLWSNSPIIVSFPFCLCRDPSSQLVFSLYCFLSHTSLIRFACLSLGRGSFTGAWAPCQWIQHWRKSHLSSPATMNCQWLLKERGITITPTPTNPWSMMECWRTPLFLTGLYTTNICSELKIARTMLHPEDRVWSIFVSLLLFFFLNE